MSALRLSLVMRGVAAMAMLWASRAAAQGSSAAVADSSPFRPLSLPAPNLVRGGAGRPGPRYWQQRADYRIEATLDPERNEVRASETVHYVNNSSDALPYVWMFVEQNLCAPTSITNVLNQPPLVFLGSAFDFSCQGFAGGLTLDYIRRPGVSGRGGPGRESIALKHTVYGNTMRVDLPQEFAPG